MTPNYVVCIDVFRLNFTNMYQVSSLAFFSKSLPTSHRRLSIFSFLIKPTCKYVSILCLLHINNYIATV